MSAVPPPDDERLIDRCARFTSRGRSYGLTHEDMQQEGRLALWIAEREGRIPAEPEHRRRYVLRRALGAMRDANRSAWRQQPMEVGSLDVGEWWELDDEGRGVSVRMRKVEASTDNSPEARVQMRQVIDRLLRGVRWRVARCIELLAEGLDDAGVAREMGVSPSCVSRLRKEARQVAAPLMDVSL